MAMTVAQAWVIGCDAPDCSVRIEMPGVPYVFGSEPQFLSEHPGWTVTRAGWLCPTCSVVDAQADVPRPRTGWLAISQSAGSVKFGRMSGAELMAQVHPADRYRVDPEAEYVTAPSDTEVVWFTKAPGDA